MLSQSLRSVVQVSIGVLIAAIVLQTWFVLGWVVPMTVSGSSMAPSLMGPHRMYRCPKCRREITVGLDQLPPGDFAWCSRCGERGAAMASSDRGGQRLAVDRTAFLFREPRRWEVVVVRCPERPSELCVKRVVGLPGEVISLAGGDVIVNGQVVQKSLSEQRALRRAIDDGGAESGPPTEVDTAGVHEWTQIANKIVPTTDEFSYNQSAAPPTNDVPDVMITFRARLAGSGQLQLTATGDAGNAEAVADFSRREVVLRLDGKDVGTGALPVSLVDGRATEWTYSLFDRQVLLAVADEIVLAEPLLWDVSSHASHCVSLKIGVRGLTGEIDRVAVWRDQYYAVRHGDGRQPGARRNGSVAWRLGPDQYFVVGDNAAISDDSRNWRSGAGLDAKLLIGKTLCVR